MSALYGYLSSDRPGNVTRASSRRIVAEVQTWTDKLALTLDRDGSFDLYREAGPSGRGPRVLIASGNVSNLGRISTDCDAA
jgi:hypothetical protein